MNWNRLGSGSSGLTCGGNAVLSRIQSSCRSHQSSIHLPNSPPPPSSPLTPSARRPYPWSRLYRILDLLDNLLPLHATGYRSYLSALKLTLARRIRNQPAPHRQFPRPGISTHLVSHYLYKQKKGGQNICVHEKKKLAQTWGKELQIRQNVCAPSGSGGVVQKRQDQSSRARQPNVWLWYATLPSSLVGQ